MLQELQHEEMQTVRDLFSEHNLPMNEIQKFTHETWDAWFTWDCEETIVNVEWQWQIKFMGQHKETQEKMIVTCNYDDMDVRDRRMEDIEGLRGFFNTIFK